MKKLKKIKSLIPLLFSILALFVMACNKNLYGYLGKGYSENTKSEFQGNVIIVGAGASGLAIKY